MDADKWNIFILEDDWHEIKSEVMVHNKYEKKLIRSLIDAFIKKLDEWAELYCEEKI